MKIAIIGTTAYQEKMKEHKEEMEKQGNTVKVPAFDNLSGTEYQICDYNRRIIEWADEVHVLWDSRSIGTVFDLGMCFALQKKIVIVYLQSKTFRNFVEQYAEKYING
jgi:nucleoside 2-deoxyribosyltransferase